MPSPVCSSIRVLIDVNSSRRWLFSKLSLVLLRTSDAAREGLRSSLPDPCVIVVVIGTIGSEQLCGERSDEESIITVFELINVR